MKKILLTLIISLLPLKANAVYHATQEYSDIACIQHCGHGYFYDVEQTNYGSDYEHIVCTSSPHDCGKDCEVRWHYRTAPNDERYICREATKIPLPRGCNSGSPTKECQSGQMVQKRTSKPSKTQPAKTGKHHKVVTCNLKCSFPDRPRNKKDDDCERLCGDCFYYDRPGDKLNGRERVCTKYPCDCGYNCTKGWDIRYLVNGTEYTCQEAIQSVSGAKPSRKTKNKSYHNIENRLLK